MWDKFSPLRQPVANISKKLKVFWKGPSECIWKSLVSVGINMPLGLQQGCHTREFKHRHWFCWGSVFGHFWQFRGQQGNSLSKTKSFGSDKKQLSVFILCRMWAGKITSLNCSALEEFQWVFFLKHCHPLLLEPEVKKYLNLARKTWIHSKHRSKGMFTTVFTLAFIICRAQNICRKNLQVWTLLNYLCFVCLFFVLFCFFADMMSAFAALESCSLTDFGHLTQVWIARLFRPLYPPLKKQSCNPGDLLLLLPPGCLLHLFAELFWHGLFLFSPQTGSGGFTLTSLAFKAKTNCRKTQTRFYLQRVKVLFSDSLQFHWSPSSKGTSSKSQTAFCWSSPPLKKRLPIWTQERRTFMFYCERKKGVVLHQGSSPENHVILCPSTHPEPSPILEKKSCEASKDWSPNLKHKIHHKLQTPVNRNWQITQGWKDSRLEGYQASEPLVDQLMFYQQSLHFLQVQTTSRLLHLRKHNKQQHSLRIQHAVKSQGSRVFSLLSSLLLERNKKLILLRHESKNYPIPSTSHSLPFGCYLH